MSSVCSSVGSVAPLEVQPWPRSVVRRNRVRSGVMPVMITELRPRIRSARGRLLRPLVRFREMRFPTFQRAIHEQIAISTDYFREATMALAVQRVLDEDV